ncbi:ATP synthase protein [Ancistrocladus abbreviatus]
MRWLILMRMNMDRVRDDLAVGFHFLVSERFVPRCMIKASIVELIREGLVVLRMVWIGEVASVLNLREGKIGLGNSADSGILSTVSKKLTTHEVKADPVSHRRCKSRKVQASQ